MLKTSRREDRLPTRVTLIRRVQNESARTQWEAGWEEFYAIYRPLVFGVARQKGLTPEEAQDVVMEVMAQVRRWIARFDVNRKKGPFKGWLLTLVRWRVADKLRERMPLTKTDPTAAIETRTLKRYIASQECSENEWNSAWHKRILEEALERVRVKANKRQFQIFRVCTSKKIPAKKIAESFGVSVIQVYLAKHRIAKLIKKEAQRLERVMDHGDEPEKVVSN